MLKTTFHYLTGLHPIIPWALLTLAVWLTIYAVRRWLPSLWLPLTKWPTPESPASVVVQTLPSIILGSAWAGLALGDPWDAVYGALAGVLAPLWHHLLKLAPVPYQGLLQDTATKAAARWRKTLPGALVVLLVGCGAPAKPRPPERSDCYKAAERKAFQRGVTECAGYESTDVCPAYIEIDADMQREQEACP